MALIAYVIPLQVLTTTAKLMLEVIFETFVRGELLSVSEFNVAFASHDAKVKTQSKFA
ncbi:hypothetical protein GCM10027341_02450 [Spirosoma knui]